MNSEQINAQVSPLGFKKRLQSEPQVERLPIEYAFTPPLPNPQGSFFVLAYTTPGLPTHGFTVNAPDFLIVADYPQGTVHAIQAVTPAQLNLPRRDLGPLQVVQWSYEQGEQNRLDFDSIYSQFLASYASGGRSYPSEKDCSRFQELWPLFIPKQITPALRHLSPKFMGLVDHCAGK